MRDHDWRVLVVVLLPDIWRIPVVRAGGGDYRLTDDRRTLSGQGGAPENSARHLLPPASV